MRSLALLLVAPLLACGSSPRPADFGPDAPSDSNSGPPPPPPTFQITTPTVDVYPERPEITFCYYFRTPNASSLSIKKWASHMTAGAQDMILYLTTSDLQPPSTLSAGQCGISNHSAGPIWTYAAQAPDAEASMPADDGEGHPVGQPIKAYQSGFLQVHFVNTTSSVIHAHAELSAFAHDAGVQVTPAGSYVTYILPLDNTSNPPLFLGPGSVASPAKITYSNTCDVPADSGKPPHFFAMTTHTHKQAVHTSVKEGTATVFDSTSWAQPGTTTWDAPPYFTFATGKLTYQCDYVNANNYSLYTGDDPTTQEQCMAIGFYFPAINTAGHFCLNNGLVF